MTVTPSGGTSVDCVQASFAFGEARTLEGGRVEDGHGLAGVGGVQTGGPSS